MKRALAKRTDVTALACLDDRAGVLLGLYVQGDMPLGEVENALNEARSSSAVWVQAFARVEARPDLVVVGLARADADVTHLGAWLREVAVCVGAA